MNRLLVLDSLRGIAALAVVIFHYTANYRKRYGHNFSASFDFDYGWLGVQLFFMISGFVIFLTINHTKSWQDFVFKRFSRLYPTYWFCLALTFIAVSIWGLEGRERSFTDFIINFSMIQNLFKVPHVDGVYWSLFPELMFYVMMLSLYIFKLRDKVIYLGGAWIGLSFININLFSFGPLSWMLNLEYAYFFYSGILFYLLRFESKQKQIIKIQLLVSFLLSVFAFSKSGDLTYQLIIVGIYIVFYLFSIDKLDFLAVKPLVLLGSISFPLYLFHQNIGFIIMNYSKEFFGDSPLIVLPPLGLSLISAYIITIYIEKPTLKFMRGRYSKYSLGVEKQQAVREELQNA